MTCPGPLGPSVAHETMTRGGWCLHLRTTTRIQDYLQVQLHNLQDRQKTLPRQIILGYTTLTKRAFLK